jgi:hypothetical protein
MPPTITSKMEVWKMKYHQISNHLLTVLIVAMVSLLKIVLDKNSLISENKYQQSFFPLVKK